MKRSPALQPLSREHHRALKLAKQCARAAASGDAAQVAQTCHIALQDFAGELEPHFLAEESELLPRLPDAEQCLVARTLQDHGRLRDLRNGLQRQEAVALAEFASCLAAHVRFEERELFPAVEATYR